MYDWVYPCLSKTVAWPKNSNSMEQIAGFSLSLSLSLSFHCHLHKFKERRDVDQLYTCQRPVHVNGGVSMGILLSNGPIFPNIFGYSYHIMPKWPKSYTHCQILPHVPLFPTRGFAHPSLRQGVKDSIHRLPKRSRKMILIPSMPFPGHIKHPQKPWFRNGGHSWGV